MMYIYFCVTMALNTISKHSLFIPLSFNWHNIYNVLAHGKRLSIRIWIFLQAWSFQNNSQCIYDKLSWVDVTSDVKLTLLEHIASVLTAVLLAVVDITNCQHHLTASSVFVIDFYCFRLYHPPMVKVPHDDVDPKYGKYFLAISMLVLLQLVQFLQCITRIILHSGVNFPRHVFFLYSSS